jgi:hypothetical protein
LIGSIITPLIKTTYVSRNIREGWTSILTGDVHAHIEKVCRVRRVDYIVRCFLG